MNPYTVAEESLPVSSKERGQQGMQRTSAPAGPNLYDGSPIASAAATNNQDFSNTLLAGQNASENIRSAIPGKVGDAIGNVRDNAVLESDAAYNAQRFANDHLATMLVANSAGPKLMELNSIMQSPERAKFMGHIATQKVIGMHKSPDLGAAAASAAQYG